MTKSARKGVILGIKILVSLALLWWVLSQVHWHDFAVLADGKTDIAVRELRPAPGGNLLLVYPNGREEVRSPASLSPVEKASGAAATTRPTGPAAYLHPGFWSSIRGIHLGVAIVGALAFVASTLVISYRWWRLVRVQGVALSLWEATRLTFLGWFFNYIVLGTTGGDLVKAYYLSKHNASKTASLVTVLVDRLLGLLGLTLLSAIMLSLVLLGRAWFDPQGQYNRQFGVAGLVAGTVLAGLSAMAAVVFSRRLRRWLRVEKVYRRFPLAEQLSKAGEAVRRYREHPLAMLRAMGQTLLAHLAFIGGVALVGASLGLAIPWYQYFIFVPLIYIIAAVPIVPGGVGLAESFYVTFFIAWSTQSQILALALLARIIPMFWALPGVVVYLTGPRVPRGDELKAVMQSDATNGV